MSDKPVLTLKDLNKDTILRNQLIDNNNLLSGIIVTADGPEPSSRQLIVRPTSLNVEVDTTSKIETTLVETDYCEKLIESNYTKLAIEASAPYVSATASYDHSNSSSHTTSTKTILCSARYLFPQGRVDFDLPGRSGSTTQLTPDFLSGIDSALGLGSEQDQREALYDVFQEYGQVFRTSVRIGGVLSGNTKDILAEVEDENKIKNDIAAGLSATVGDFGGKVNSSFGSESTTIKTSSNHTLNVTWIVTGGDATGMQQVGEWIKSTQDHNYWRIVQVEAVIPVVEMLEGDRLTRVSNLMKPFIGRWVPTTAAAPGPSTMLGEANRLMRPTADLQSGWFWTGCTVRSETLILAPTFKPRAGVNPPYAKPPSLEDGTPRLHIDAKPPSPTDGASGFHLEVTRAIVLNLEPDEYIRRQFVAKLGFLIATAPGPPGYNFLSYPVLSPDPSSWTVPEWTKGQLIAIRSDLITKGDSSKVMQFNEFEGTLNLTIVSPDKSSPEGGIDLQSASLSYLDKAGVVQTPPGAPPCWVLKQSSVWIKE